MSVRASITTELAVAVGKIAATHNTSDYYIEIHYRDSDPEEIWTVTASGESEHVYTVNDETGEIRPELPAPEVWIVTGFNDATEETAVFVRQRDAETFAQTYDSACVQRVTVCDVELAARLIASREDTTTEGSTA